MTKRRRVHEKSDAKLSKKRHTMPTMNNHGATDTALTSNGVVKTAPARSRFAALSPSLRSLWLFSCGLRVVWTLIGQNGYIHPDEFFQGPEVVAGDVLDLKVGSVCVCAPAFV